ncbi:MAG: ATP phosphoribosyltransferase regulatory subunit, partial [Verrucomicrobiota bacterium]|nr:ATP phosphoribosyltransferase regulatory subunit [Verrucomicrobiota bacterium]
FGLNDSDFKVRLSDRDLWLLMLAAEGLDEAGSATVLGIIDKMERTDRTKTIEKLALMLGDEAEDFLGRMEEAIAIEDFDTLRIYIDNLPLEGDLAVQAKARIEEWSQLLRNLNAAGVGDFVKIDLGIVRGLAYYTGFVFEAYEASGEGRAIAGGGRYDALVKKLGGPDMPAVGFAMGDVTLVDLLESKSLVPEYIQSPEFIAIIGGEDERPVALADVAHLRAVGYQIEYPFKNQGLAKQFKSANQSGARFALIYGSEELERGVVKVRDLSKGSELEIPRDQLVIQAPSLLESGIE